MTWLKTLLKGFRGKKKLTMPSDKDLYDSVRLTPIFRDVPEEKLRKMIADSTPVLYKDADVVVREGDEGDSYFLILEGMASVVRRKAPGQPPRVVAVLAPGFAFGEEALISNSKRNATVIMETDGILLKIPKGSFVDNVVQSLVSNLSPIEAQRMIHSGSKWLDVRADSDYRRSHLPHAISMPHEEMRERLSELDPAIMYICYCDNGRISSAAAFLMRLAGYNAAVLQGGLKRMDQRFRGGA